MATKVRRIAPAEDTFDVSSLTAKVTEFALVQDQIKTLETRLKGLKKDLSGAVEENGEPDEKGHIWLQFPQPINGIKALQRQRRVGQSLDEQRAGEILAERNLVEKCYKLVPVLDDEAVMAALYEGELSEADVDAMYVKSVSYAFVPVRG